MRYLILSAVGAIMTAYGLSDGLNQLGSNSGRILGWLGVIITVFAAIFQYRHSKPFEVNFTEQSWQMQTEHDYILHILSSQHAKGANATATVYLANEKGHEEVMCEVHTKDGGDIEIQANKPFKGKLLIR